MTIKTFLKLVEIQTKTASMLPFFFGTLFAVYRYESFAALPFAVMLFSLLVFDMTTTAINNYMDYRKSGDEEYRKNHNIIGSAGLKLSRVRILIILMLSLAVSSGILLVLLTGPLVLLLGIGSFFVGIFYTFGPIPISRMPLGEILSGLLMGFVIIYLSVYIHSPDLATIGYESGRIIFDFALWDTGGIFLAALPFTLAISNLMLANNICDLEQDVINDRYLLPYYLGRERSLLLYSLCAVGAMIAPVAAVAMGFLPYISMASALVFIPVSKNLRTFGAKQLKAETFVTAVQNLVLISFANIIPLGIALLYRMFPS